MADGQGELDLSAPPAPVSEKDHPWFKELGGRIVIDFWTFNARLPHVYGLFKKYALEAKQSGRSRFGIGMIAERVRWFVSVEATGTEEEDFKLNNNLRSCYARLLMIREPELDGLFELRASTPSHREAADG